MKEPIWREVAILIGQALAKRWHRSQQAQSSADSTSTRQTRSHCDHGEKTKGHKKKNPTRSRV
jgi:hypothetical protein